jgi:hypothetical protein
MTMKSADQICLELITGYIRDKQEIAKALGTDPIHNDMLREAETLTQENRHLRDHIAAMSDMIDHRDEALLCIGRIFRDKETQHKDLMLGSNAFKSALSWAEKYLPDKI